MSDPRFPEVPEVTARRAFRGLGFVALLVALAIALMYFVNPLHMPSKDLRLRLFGWTTYRQPTVAMEPTIRYQEVFTASAWPYRGADPRPGDIVVFEWPRDPSVRFVKRVIAAGGSTVEIVEGVTRVDGRALAEPYLHGHAARRDSSRHMAPVHVPAGSYFMMGDNRDQSDDSRDWGAVPRELILARVDRP
jgi:signal peptidase I